MTTVGLTAEVAAILIYLLPAIIALVWTLARGAVLAEASTWMPAALAVDLVGILALTLIMPLGAACLVSRLLWVATLAAWYYRSRPRFARPRSTTTWQQLAVVVLAGSLSFALSASISRPASIWDRQFHIPLVGMMGGQRIPFQTVFQPHTTLHFHFAGDVIAVAIQTFSLGRIHASLAIAILHDLMFLITGISFAIFLLNLSLPRAWIVLAVLTVFVGGPFALQRAHMGSLTAGYSYLNTLCISYRPSIAVTILFLTGAFTSLWSQTFAGARLSRNRFTAVMFAIIAALGISDEPTAAFVALMLAVLWVVDCERFFGTRQRGVLVMLGVGAAIVLPNLIFQAALVPGGPVQNVHLVALRSPGFAEPSLPLTTRNGLYALLLDLAPFLLIILTSAGLAFRVRERRTLGVFFALVVVFLVSAFALTALDFNGMAMENHRFATFWAIVFPLVGAAILTDLPAGRWERIPVIGALVLASVSTYHWYQYGVGPAEAYYTNRVDCRSSAGARLLERARPTYVPLESFFKFSGCRAVLYPGSPNANSWSGVLFNGYPIGGRSAFDLLNRDFVAANESLQIACPIDSSLSDPACAYARKRRLCVPAGKRFETCELDGGDRQRVLASNWQ